MADDLRNTLQNITAYLKEHPSVKKEKLIEGFIFYEQEADAFKNSPEDVISRDTLHGWLRKASRKTFKPHAPLVERHAEHLAAYYKTLADGADVKWGNCVYLITEQPFSGFFKVGIVTTGTLHERLHDLQTGNPRKLVLLEHIRCKNAKATEALETFMHESFGEMNAVGEWFACDTEHDLKYVRVLFNMISSGSLKKK